MVMTTSKKNALNKVSLKHPLHFLSLGFGSGCVSFAPGTFGTIAALPLVYAMSFLSLSAYLSVTLFACLIGVYLCHTTAKAMEVHDHPAIVWDEIAGMMITMVMVPMTVTNLAVGFILFRFFDIVKPWPIKWIDKHVHGGIGIMLDDIIAGILACAVIHLALVYAII